ncbi:TetR/AcrR family transcriptional regulator [Actinoplanes sp. NPDC049265]|uniref:TetR/AcrR family transcriptional regulator n=1 Tax=Actinoplanes sp. NPDC049265 TaxID=3363902 RepID=UPI00371F0AEB
MAGQRADARRNYARLLAVASQAVAEDGAAVSLEQIGRTAGVGSGTVRRHFPSRDALLEAVFEDHVEALCADARDRAGADDARDALAGWLHAVSAAAATLRGLAFALNREAGRAPCATSRLTEAGRPLVRRAAGRLTPGVSIADLLRLVTGIALATEHTPDPAGEAARLLDLALAGFLAGPLSSPAAPR